MAISHIYTCITYTQAHTHTYTQNTHRIDIFLYLLYRKEKPPPVAPGAWLREELKLKQAKTAGIEPGDPNLTTPSAPSPSQDK